MQSVELEDPAATMLADMAQVLLVEDEEDIAFPLIRTLEREGYDVTGSPSARGARPSRLDAADVVILDLGLPDMDGLDVCRQLRATGATTAASSSSPPAPGSSTASSASTSVRTTTSPSRSASPSSRPGSARCCVAAGQRRPRGGRRVIDPSALRIDPDARRVTLGDDEIALTAKEFDVLALLAAHRDKVVPREQLMSQVWDENWFGSTKTLDVTIGRLRNKLEEAGSAERVVAIRGVGFRLEGGD